MASRRPATVFLIVVVLLVLASGWLMRDHVSRARLLRVAQHGRARLAALMEPRPPALGPPSPTRFGLNISAPSYFGGERAFTNLALAATWQVEREAGTHDAVAGDFSPDGSLVRPPDARRLRIYLAPPYDADPAPWIVCRYRGAGHFTVHGAAADQAPVAGGFRFRWLQKPGSFVWLIVDGLDPARPLGGLDCREPDRPATERFRPDFVALIHSFAAIRFMGWQRVNANEPVTWATRRTPSAQEMTIADGVSVEDMVRLAAEAQVDPWFTMPWNADDDYVTRFATYVRDHLPRDRTIYVEVANEVWNTAFPVARQAQREGLAAGLSNDPREAGLRRYAQRTIEVMRIWERVFAHEPARLVRVAATQQVNPATARTVLAFPGLPDHVDALATAPYFGEDVRVTSDSADLAGIFAVLDAAMRRTIDLSVANRSVATRYGKRYIAYEAGQAVTLYRRQPLVARIERDPRMYDLYRAFIARWRARVGDLVMFLSSTAPIKEYAWGLQEYSGQPLRDAPKLRAILDARDHGRPTPR